MAGSAGRHDASDAKKTTVRHGAAEAENTVSTANVPVVFVPGFMGTRLMVRNRRWDPDQKMEVMIPEWVRATLKDKQRFLDCNNKATILTDDPYATNEGRTKKGHYSVYQKSYGGFIGKMLEASFGTARHPLHVVGYDWRQSPRDSAVAVKEKILEITKKERARKVIVITHSMGGLVARWACMRFPELVSAVKGVIHVAQPVAGAPKLHRYLLAGLAEEWGDGDLTKIFRTVSETASLVTAMPAALELLPTSHYELPLKPVDFPPDRSQLARSWYAIRSVAASYDPTVRDLAKTSVKPDDRFIERPASRYDDTNGSGLYFEHAHPPSLKSKLSRQAGVAMKRQRELGLNRHPETWSFVCQGTGTDATTTDVGTLMNQADGGEYRGHTPIRAERAGDGTVPLMSAGALHPDQCHDPTRANLTDDSKRQFKVYAGQHDSCMSSEEVCRALAILIPHIASRT